MQVAKSNLFFWSDIQCYRSHKQQNTLDSEALDLYTNYLGEDANCDLVPKEVAADIKALLSKGPPFTCQLFDIAANSIVTQYLERPIQKNVRGFAEAAIYGKRSNKCETNLPKELFAKTAGVLEKSDGWTLVVDKGDIAVLQKTANNSMLIKEVMEVNSKWETVVAHMSSMEYEGAASDIKDASVIEQLGPETHIFYAKLSRTIPLSKKGDLVYFRSHATLEDGSWIALATSVNHEKKPASSKTIRCDLIIKAYLVRRVNENSCRVIVATQIDYKTPGILKIITQDRYGVKQLAKTEELKKRLENLK